MGEQNRNYYRARAEQELTAAARATNPAAESAHLTLARRYHQMATDLPQGLRSDGALSAAE